MRTKRLFLRIVIIVVITLEVVISAGCNTVNDTTEITSSNSVTNTADVNSSNSATNTADVNSSNSATNTADVNSSNSVTNTADVNSSNSVTNTADVDSLNNIDVNSQWGYMGESLGELYLLTKTDDKGTIWSAGEKLIDGEIARIYVDNGNVYYTDRSGVNKLNTEGVSQVLEKKVLKKYVVSNRKLYYMDKEKDGRWCCYNMDDKTNSLVTNEPVLFLYVNSDYIICWNPQDIYILDNNNYKTIKEMHFENYIIGCSLDKENVYFLETIYLKNYEIEYIITKYDIKKDEQITVIDTKETIGSISAFDDKIVFGQYINGQFGYRYIDMKNMENKYYTVKDYDIIDVLFDGQRIIYETRDQSFYSISIATGETKKIELIN